MILVLSSSHEAPILLLSFGDIFVALEVTELFLLNFQNMSVGYFCDVTVMLRHLLSGLVGAER